MTNYADNIAPPIASCLGDLVTLSLVGLVSLGLIDFIATPLPLIVVLVIVAIGSSKPSYTGSHLSRMVSSVRCHGHQQCNGHSSRCLRQSLPWVCLVSHRHQWSVDW
jgi:hypothetical protein